MKLRLFDYIALILALTALAVFSVYAWSGSGEATSVVIEAAGGEWIYPLDRDNHLHVSGPLGDTEVVIGNGTVRVSESPCTEKICVATGGIRIPGAWIACLPNRVFVRLAGEDDGEVDATAF